MWLDDFAPSMGAAIAYYTIFSIAPMLVIAIAVASLALPLVAPQSDFDEALLFQKASSAFHASYV